MELYGSFKIDTRIDRDLRPLFISNPEVGGIIASYPRVTEGWTGDNIGDFLIGVKYNLLSEADQKQQSPPPCAHRSSCRRATTIPA